MEDKRTFDAAIIGSGIGGLSVGILLSLLNYRVVIVERNPLPGGLMRGYRRDGLDCPVGVHYFGSFGEGEPLRRMCDHLGVADQMAAEEMGGGGAIDRYLFDDFLFDLPVGLDAFAASLEKAFPGDGRPIAAIVENLRMFSGLQKDFAFLSPAPLAVDPAFFAPLGDYLAGMNCSAGLRSVLGVSARWMGMPEDQCPVLYHHLALTSYLLSSWRLKGSGADLAGAFVARLKSLGGTLLCGDPATAILAPGGAVEGVRLASGTVCKAPRVVAAIHPKKAMAMLPEGLVLPRRVRRVAELCETESLFAVNASVDAAVHPALPHNIFRLRANRDGSIRGGVFYQMLRGREGRNLLVAITRSPYEEWRRWERTATGRRGADYEEEKASRAGKLLQDAEEVFGPLADAKVIDAYSPLTLRDWVDTPEGSPYGILRSVRQLPAAATLHRLGPSGLWLAGQNVLSPGVFGTLMGSFHAVRQVVGADRFAPIYEGLAKGREKPGSSGGRP